MYAEIDIDISYLTEKLSRVVYTLKCKKNKHKVFSSLNKRSTENALNWSPSCFVTAAVLPDVFSTAKSGIPFLRSPWVSCLGSMCTAWCTVLHEHRVTRLNRWESNKTKMGRDWWPNTIEGYVSLQWTRPIVAVAKQNKDQFNTVSKFELVLMLPIIH